MTRIDSRRCWRWGVGFLLLLVLGCSQDPEAVGTKTVSREGQHGFRATLTGPDKIRGELTLSEGLLFPLRMDIEGPPLGMVEIFSNIEGVQKCVMQRSMPMHTRLDREGKASVEGTAWYGTDVECEFKHSVTIASEFTEKYNQYYLGGNRDNLEVDFLIQRELDPEDPAVLRHESKGRCEEFTRDEMDGVPIRRFQWSAVAVKEQDDGSYVTEGTFSTDRFSLKVRCTMKYAGGGSWELLKIQIPGRGQV